MPSSSVKKKWIDGPGQGIVKSTTPRFVPTRAWADGRNVRFDQQGSRVRKVDGYTEFTTTPDGEAVRLLWHYLKSDGTEELVRVGLTRAWRGFGGTLAVIATGLSGAVTDVVTAAQFGDYLVWTDGKDRPMIWEGSGSARELRWNPNDASQKAPRAYVVRVHTQHLLLFNTNEFGVATPWRTSFTAVGETPEDGVGGTAGDLDLRDEASELVAAEALGDAMIVYKEDSIYRVQFVGGDDKYVRDMIPASDGAISARAVVRWGAYHYFMGANGIYRMGAIPDPVTDDETWKFIRGQIDWSRRRLIYAYPRREFREVCWKVPTLEGDEPDFTVVLNVDLGTFSYTDHDPGLCWGQYPAIIDDTWGGGADEPWGTGKDIPWNHSEYTQQLPLSLWGTRAGSVMEYGGRNANGQPIAAYLESGVHSSQSMQRLVQVPLAARGAGVIDVKTRSWLDERQALPDYAEARRFNLDTYSGRPWVDVWGYGRFHQLRLEQNALDADFELSGYALGVLGGDGER